MWMSAVRFPSAGMLPVRFPCSICGFSPTSWLFSVPQNGFLRIAFARILLSLPFADTYDLEQLELASGSWGIENGALVGRFRGNGGGICYTKGSFPGDILIDFYGTMLSPCNNDLNFVLKAEGWDYERNDAARGFIGGLNGWYKKNA